VGADLAKEVLLKRLDMSVKKRNLKVISRKGPMKVETNRMQWPDVSLTPRKAPSYVISASFSNP